jgi:hypothetical protein
VVAAYLFGSRARGSAGPLGDLDVGLLIAPGADDDAICDRVMSGLAVSLRSDRIDVLSLNRAPSPIRYRVVRDGVLVACRQAAALERFVAESVLIYLDFKPVRDRAFNRLRESIIGGG